MSYLKCPREAACGVTNVTNTRVLRYLFSTMLWREPGIVGHLSGLENSCVCSAGSRELRSELASSLSEFSCESQWESASYHGTRRGHPRAQVGKRSFFIARRFFFQGSWAQHVTSLRPVKVHCLIWEHGYLLDKFLPSPFQPVFFTATHFDTSSPWDFWPYIINLGWWCVARKPQGGFQTSLTAITLLNFHFDFLLISSQHLPFFFPFFFLLGGFFILKESQSSELIPSS